MSIKKIIFLALLSFLALSASSQVNEYYFRFTESNKEKVNTIITQIVSIDNVKGDTIYAYANSNELEKIRQLGYKPEMLTRPSLKMAKTLDMATDISQMSSWDKYPTYKVYREMMKNFEQNYPTICKLDSLGETPDGHKIYVVKISDNVATDEAEPEMFYTSTIHGDETTGYVLMLRLIDYLLSEYATNSRIKQLIDNAAIFINPNANPDGTYNSGDNTIVGATRYNANSIDLNRNFPDPRTGYHPDGNQWQPETEIMMNFAKQRHFVISANFHGGTEVANYPWDTWISSQNTHADNSWFYTISRAYADTIHLYSPSTYFNDLNNGITFGGDWYVITGGRQDYMNYWHGCREITIELSDTKEISADQLPAHWNYNYRSLINFLENALTGFYGTVKNSNGEPLDATIYIVNHDKLNSQVSTNPAFGNYYRMIEPGTYDMLVVANGYEPKILKGETIGSNERKEINITLSDNTENPLSESFENEVPDRFSFYEGDWTKSSSNVNTGNYSLKSPAISDNKSTSATLSLNVRDTGIVSFAYLISSELGYDYFRFYIDDVVQGQWSGTTDWETVHFVVTPGNHTFKWEYKKDDGRSSGSDCVWIDDIILPKCKGNVNLTTSVNSNLFDGLSVNFGDSTKVTNDQGVISLTNVTLDSLYSVSVFSENQKLGEAQLQTKWQTQNYTLDLTALFNATFEVTSDGNALSGATVNFNSEQKQTDENGNATFNGIPFSPYHSFTVSMDNFETAEGTLRLASDSTYKITLFPTGISTPTNIDALKVYPNPFSDYFWITFNLKEASSVNVFISDISGRKLTTLYSGQMQPGEIKIKGASGSIGIKNLTGNLILVIKTDNAIVHKKLIHF
ncbi:MAG TPA: M14 family zinc carboxypeptidase [Tenuifilaceae bacterium]|nr:M14 family zinc carboxypeptidase [Tenuifilaceae bacterium]